MLFWPWVALRPSGAGALIGLTGALAWGALLVLLARQPGKFSRFTNLASSSVLVIGIWAALVTDWSKISAPTLPLFFFAVTTPLALLAGVGRLPLPMLPIRVLSILFLTMEFLAPLVASSINPIGRGHLAWIAVVGVFTFEKRGLALGLIRAAVIGGAALVLLEIPNLGPKLSGAVAIVVLGLQGSKAKRIASLPQVFLLKTVLVFGALVGSYLALSGARTELAQVDSINNTTVRQLVWRDVLANGPLRGVGFENVVVEVGSSEIDLIHSHNFLVDSFHMAGVVGIALVSLVALRGAKLALERKDPHLPFYAGILVAHLTSGGLIAPVLWIVLMQMNRVTE